MNKRGNNKENKKEKNSIQKSNRKKMISKPASMIDIKIQF
jgi:hypothetical protein